MPKRFYKNQDEAIRDLQKHLPDYSKEKKYLSCARGYARLKSQLEIALDNSKKLEETNGRQDSEGCTCCNVHKLFNEIRKIRK